MNPKYTKEQQQAISTDSNDLLVAAAAGSGKTAVLVERIIRLITQPPSPVDIDRLLIVTFTDAAAGEMRTRISDALSHKLISSSLPDGDNLRKQLNLLNKAAPTTIHSFCLRVIRKYFNLLDIDPGFRIADDAEKKLMKAQVIAELFEEEYSKEGNEAFFELVESYGGSRTNDGRLEELVLDIYDFISSSPWPVQWLEDAAARFEVPEDSSLGDTIWARVIMDELQLTLTGAMEYILAAKKICLQEYGPAKYMSALESDCETVTELLNLKDIEDLFDALQNVKFARLASYTAKNRGDTSEVLLERVKYIRDKHIKETVKKCMSCFIKNPSELLKDIRAIHAPLNCLKNLTLEFLLRYSAKKKEANILDFNDLEHLCLEILLDESSQPYNPVPSRTARLIGEGYREVLTDEYQDTNLTQELILSSLGSKRFMVGDVKQSIYKFRRAAPELFMQKYKSFASIDNIQGDKEQIKIDLSVNFRSRKCVVDAVNFLFCQLMQEQTGGIDYDEKAALYYGADYPQPEGCDLGSGYIADSAELILLENSKNAPDDQPEVEETDILDAEDTIDENVSQEISELADIELEAKYITQRIIRLTGKDGLLVYDSKARKHRKAQYRDIVILLRSVRASAEIMVGELANYGIPAFANAGGGYFESTEVQTMLSMLQIIDNPRQDIHLLTVLRSPVYMLDSDELLEIHMQSPAKCFFDCLQDYIQYGSATELKSKLVDFMSRLNSWRDQAAYTPISLLIDNIYESTGLISYAAAMSGGAARIGNLRVLQERAASYENTSYKGLFHFIRYIEKLQRTQIDMDDVQALSENDNLVRIMTIHKSKGLEFPIVFVSGLGKRFNASDERNAFIMHQELGFGPYYVDLESRVRSRTLPHIALGVRLRAENLAEELRVLYVAATRAREKLIFTGCVKDIDRKTAKWSIAAKLEDKIPPHYILSSLNYLDWIAPAICRHKDGASLIPDNDRSGIFYEHPASFLVKVINKQDIISGESEYIDYKEAVPIDADNSLPDEKAEDQESNQRQIIDALEWEYPRKAESELPAKVSISEIKRRYQAEILTDKVVHVPASLRERGRFDGAEIGTAMHTVLEHLDLSKHRDKFEIEYLISQLVNSNIMEREAAAAVDVSKIVNFANSPLADRMRASPDVRTEVRFVMALSPHEVYGKNISKKLDSKIMLHGIIDCFFEEDGSWILVDYKSDYVAHPSKIKEISDKYALQLNFYARAIESRTGKPVKERLLYLFAIDKEICLFRR